MYHPLITEYFEAQKPFKFQHPMRLETVDWTIHSIDFNFDAGEIDYREFPKDKIHGMAGQSAWRQAISLSKLLEILQNQE